MMLTSLSAGAAALLKPMVMECVWLPQESGQPLQAKAFSVMYIFQAINY